MARISSYQGDTETLKKHPVSGAELPDPVEEDESRTLYRRPLRGMANQNRHAHFKARARLRF